MLASVLALVLLDALSLELFLVCSLLVLLVATELTAPPATKQPLTGESLRLTTCSRSVTRSPLLDRHRIRRAA